MTVKYFATFKVEVEEKESGKFYWQILFNDNVILESDTPQTQAMAYESGQRQQRELREKLGDEFDVLQVQRIYGAH